MSRVFLYARVSTADQSTENQVREVAAAGFAIEPQRVIEEAISGSVSASQRKGFARLMDRLEAGDVLVVTKLDRLGRSALDVRQTVDLLATRGIRVHCLALGGADLTSAAGKMVMMVLVAVAEFERDLIIERTHAGLIRAKAQGRVGGRPSALNIQQQDEALGLLRSGNSISEVARKFKTSRTSIQRLQNKFEQRVGS